MPSPDAYPALHGAPELERAIRAFRAVNGAPYSGIDLTLIDGLLGRFDHSPSRSTTNAAAFSTFESYLHLTSRVRSDAAALTFLRETHDRRSQHDRDLPILLSPHHLAEAFATSVIDGVPVADVSAGYRVLGYFDWLAEIIESAREDAELRRGIVRHASWAQKAERVQDRFKFWGERMCEWDVSAEERTSADPWPANATRVFYPLLSEQRAVKTITQSATQQVLGAMQQVLEGIRNNAAPTVDQLLAEGRVGAARRLVLGDAIAAEKELQSAANSVLVVHLNVETLVAHCERLAELGGVDAAAALLAPWVSTIVAKHGTENEILGRTLTIVSRSRAEGEGTRNQQESHNVDAIPRSH